MRAALLALVMAASLVAPAVAGEVDHGNYTTFLRGPQCRPHEPGPASDPGWARPRRMTVVTDSVLIGGVPALKDAKPCWRVAPVGRPFLNLRDAERTLRGRRIAPVAVIGLGYNSSWERDRLHYRFWADHFDDDARRLLRTMRRGGARRFVWVTVRQPTKRTTPRRAWPALPLAWYLRYVNERLRKLDRSRDDLVLADWNAASRKPTLTYDAIHLNPRGARLMARTIRGAIRAESRRGR